MVTATAGDSGSWAFGLPVLALGDLVPVARALNLVPVGPRRHTLALLEAHPAVAQAQVYHAGLGASHFALGLAEG